MPKCKKYCRKRAPALKGGRYAVARRAPRRRRRGKGFFGDVWKGVSKFGKSANRFLKRSKAISTLAPLFGERGAKFGKVAKLAGYGHRRRMVRRRRGRGVSLAGGAGGRGIRLAGRSGRGYSKKTYPKGMSY